MIVRQNSAFEVTPCDNLACIISSSVNPIPNRLGHVTYNERADSALT